MTLREDMHDIINTLFHDRVFCLAEVTDEYMRITGRSSWERSHLIAKFWGFMKDDEKDGIYRRVRVFNKKGTTVWWEKVEA